MGLVAAAGCQAGSGGGTSQAPRARLELVDAPATSDAAATIAALLPAAARDHKHLVVYVGATWCEPCRYFHDAAAAGQLDDQLGDLRVVTFDIDRDGAALGAAGYVSEMIPLFAIPRSDGHATGDQIAGSIKGSGAAQQITPRLRALVDHTPQPP
nr:hypothetical protein [Kofleriaceae bacterium]